LVHLLFHDKKLNDNISQEVRFNLEKRAEKDLKKIFDRGSDAFTNGL
jgi:hypothetical protein